MEQRSEGRRSKYGPLSIGGQEKRAHVVMLARIAPWGRPPHPSRRENQLTPDRHRASTATRSRGRDNRSLPPIDSAERRAERQEGNREEGREAEREHQFEESRIAQANSAGVVKSVEGGVLVDRARRGSVAGRT